MGSLAAETRAAVRGHPFLRTALRAGVVNYAAAARYLDVDGDDEAVATALRRLVEDLPPYETDERRAPVRIERGVGRADGGGLLSVGDAAFATDAGSLTALLASGAVDAAALRAALGRLDAAGVTVEAAAVGGGALVVVIDGNEADALRAVEAALSAVPA